MFPTIIILAVIAIPFAVIVFLYRRPLPKVNGTTRVQGINAPVEIIRDKWGVPHIYAQNLDDLLFAQGYVHAQDRLWQMELSRRVGHGRLSEMFGKIAADTDKMLRTIGLSRAAQNDLVHQDAEVMHTLETYARGVNSYVQSNPLPIEFTILGFKPEPWQPLDTLVWSKVMAWGLSVNWDSELLHALFIEKLGPANAAQLKGQYDPNNPLVFQDHTFVEMMDHFVEHFHAAREWLPLRGVSGMSNNWVVDGTKSVTGKPLLANDPHLGLQMPSIWYENHLVAPELEVTGVSFPGTPGVVIGHNRDLAWGFTNAFPDVQDLYVEKFSPDDPTLYEFQGRWEKASILREEIRVKGEREPRVAEIRVTRHGPIISDMLELTAHYVTEGLALRWVAYEANHNIRAFLNLNRARNWKEFGEALRDFAVPSQNVVYADREGNIGYYMPGLVPIRAKGNGLVPVPGWTGEYEWTGFIPHEKLPHAFTPCNSGDLTPRSSGGPDPAPHYFASANNVVVGQEYPYFLTAETQSGFRARRIVELLTAQVEHPIGKTEGSSINRNKLSADDFARMHVDVYCAPAKPFCELLTLLAPLLLDHPALASNLVSARKALDLVKAWDYRLTADSVAGALFKLTEYFAQRRLFEPWFGELTDYYLGAGFNPVVMPVFINFLDFTPLVMQRIVVNNETDWFKGKNREEILASALNDAIVYLRKAVGDDIRQWQWGRIHAAGFNHPLGAVKPLDRIFNRGPYPYGGDINTVWQASFVPKLPLEPGSGFTASYRQIIDVSDWDASRAVHTTGQSGQPASKHYADLIPLWLKGEYHPMLWAREKVEAQAEGKLKLIPLSEKAQG